MAIDIEGLRTDAALEEDGVWTEVPLFGEMLNMRIARLGNKAFERAQEARQKPYVNQIRAGTLSVEIQEKILIECVARHIVKDWRDLTRGGEDFPYSVENAVWLLSSNRDLLNAVVRLSGEAERYRQQQIETDAGN